MNTNGENLPRRVVPLRADVLERYKQEVERFEFTSSGSGCMSHLRMCMFHSGVDGHPADKVAVEWEMQSSEFIFKGHDGAECRVTGGGSVAMQAMEEAVRELDDATVLSHTAWRGDDGTGVCLMFLDGSSITIVSRARMEVVYTIPWGIGNPAGTMPFMVLPVSAVSDPIEFIFYDITDRI